MAEYIDREVLLVHIAGVKVHLHGDDDWMVGYRDALQAVGELVQTTKAVDVEPVRHGRWVGLEYDGYADGCPVYDLWECSECGEEVRGEDVPDTHPWCHGCGAKMDKEEKE